MFADLVVSVEERHRMLPDELDSTERKFNGQRFLVDRFQEARTKCSVYSDRGSNNFLRKFGVSERIFSCFPAFLIHIFKSFLSRRLFPSRGRGPWGRWKLILPRLILRMCTRVGGMGEWLFGRATQILPGIFRQNFASATHRLRQMRKWSAPRCYRQSSSVFSDLPPRGCEGIEIHRDIVDCDFAFNCRTVSLSFLPLEALIGAQHFRRAAARNNG